MKQGYVIDIFGTQKPQFVLIYNWESINKISVSRYEDFPSIIIAEPQLVAIFKIKWKS